MKITFNLRYHTEWGQQLAVCGAIPVLGSTDESVCPAMELTGPDTWSLTIDCPEPPAVLTYHYLVKTTDGYVCRREWGAPHSLPVARGVGAVIVEDWWQDMPADKFAYSSAFTGGFFRRDNRDAEVLSRPGTVRFSVQAPLVGPGQALALLGQPDALGKWNPEKALVFNDSKFPVWTLDVPLAGMPEACEYKLLVIDKATREIAAWEARDNRHLILPSHEPLDQVVIAGLRAVSPFAPWRGAGTAVPVFSLRSEADFGVGDFADLKAMADWCAATGQKVLQLLPVNDTTLTGTWVDSYPYRANSTFALHPMFLRLEDVGTLKDKVKAEAFEKVRKELNALPQVDYEKVNNTKNEWLHAIYAQDGANTLTSAPYLAFFEANRHWLLPYAAWSVLRDDNGTPDETRWGSYSTYEKEKIAAFIAKRRDEIGYYCFVQYHLDRQLRSARDYARSLGVVLKGDVPIGIGRHSVDAWLYPQLFNLNSQAGAPPDDFSVFGQNWGFPTYNWDEMAKDGFAWWKSRFRKMAEYFDAYRIDHILGFFRIWQIPESELHGLLGVFNPALPFTPEELSSRGFHIDVELQTKPLIEDWMLDDFFAPYTDEVKEKFLELIGDGRYRLRDVVNTQKKVAAYFSQQEKSEKNEKLCDSLLGLIDEVLFIEDPYRKGYYHPRISAQSTYQYRRLSDWDKGAFDALYNDFFYHRNDDFWRGKALWKLPPLIDATRMLCCAEDLGMIPACVPDVMHRLQILSLEIQRMPKDLDETFADTWHYPYLSVCTTSTHDMPGIRQWWESDPALAQRYYTEVLHEPGGSPFYAEPWICGKILRLHLESPSMLCIIPLQDWLSADAKLRRHDPREEQINEPSNPEHYWRYRMHLTLEQLQKEDSFNKALADSIARSNR